MNILLSTDVYKVGHMEQYPDGINKVYSYLCARKDFSKTDVDKIVFWGLRYYLIKYLSQRVTKEHVEEFVDVFSPIVPLQGSTIQKLYALSELGYIPLKIKAVKEGEKYPLQNVLLTITNTHPKFYWLVNYFESLILKLWYSCSVATRSRQYLEMALSFADMTCSNHDHIPYCVHDFGYRSVSSEESAMLGGAAHLTNFYGSDNILGEYCLKTFYGMTKAKSVPASEHSVMCSFTPEKEIEAFHRMLDIYPTGIVSIVSDTYNLWNVLTNFAKQLKNRILSRDGKLVFRPDSGDPYKIILGDPASSDPAVQKGSLNLLWEEFGGTTNSKGFKVLNPKVGLIYGDGIHLERYKQILEGMKQQGFASSNLVIGVGGLLLQNHSRDDFGFAQKTTYVEISEEPLVVFKDPITDKKKKSHKGLLCLLKDENGRHYTKDNCTWEEEAGGELNTVFEDGKLFYENFKQAVLT